MVMTLQDKIAATADKCKTVAECALQEFSDNFTLAAVSQDDGCLAAIPSNPSYIPPELEPLAAAIGKAPANDNTDSFFDRAMRAPCGAPLPNARRDIKMHIVNEAARVVTGARRKDYGTPEDNFERIAKFWQAYFENTGRGSVAITAQDVSPMMRLMKEARLCESPNHLDSFVDIVGYTMTGAEVNGVEVAG